ncbi:unnamed protein product [Ectocarpus sp. 13 AM-2016]
MPKIGAAKVGQHLKNRHGGVGALLGTKMTPGRLA